MASRTVCAPGCPDGLALVAVSGWPSKRTSSVAMGWLDRRTPMPPLAVDQRARNIVARRQYQGQRPRPEVRHQLFRQRGNFRHQRIEHRPIGDEHGKWVVGIAAFEVKDVFDGGKIQRVGAETVERFGGKDDHFAAFERGQRIGQVMAMLRVHIEKRKVNYLATPGGRCLCDSACLPKRFRRSRDRLL